MEATNKSAAFKIIGCVDLGENLSPTQVLRLKALTRVKITSWADLKAKYSKTQNEFDRSAVGQVPVYCPSCRPCNAGEYAGCACGPFDGTKGYWQNCGWSAAKQPVACCATGTHPNEKWICSPKKGSACN